ncbi:hypothetical protein BU198_38875 [Streptomyces sp. CBMA156]|nr:hypothetical protein [Streptomyces sp. CBMA156]
MPLRGCAWQPATCTPQGQAHVHGQATQPKRARVSIGGAGGDGPAPHQTEAGPTDPQEFLDRGGGQPGAAEHRAALAGVARLPRGPASAEGLGEG